MENDNLLIWNKVKHPPEDALSVIPAGRLKGMTDIKPQWRYKIMTEQFGIFGVGWYFEYINKWIEKGSYEQKVAFVDINLFIKIGDVWSKPIPGTGGSLLITKEKAGLHTSDEAYKMATTDALSTAMKMIGVAADIYMGEFSGGKYKNKSEEPNDGKNDFGTPEHPFDRDNIIEFGMHSKTGKGKDKKWLELSDKYLNILNDKVTGGYKKFIEKEISFRANDKKLQEGKKEQQDNKKPETPIKEETKKVEKPVVRVEEKPTEDENEIDNKLRIETVEKINEMKKMGDMKPESAKAWINKAETLNDPIRFHRFYWAVSTAILVCKASNANKINRDTKVAYFKTIKKINSKISDFEPIMADMNKLLDIK